NTTQDRHSKHLQPRNASRFSRNPKFNRQPRNAKQTNRLTDYQATHNTQHNWQTLSSNRIERNMHTRISQSKDWHNQPRYPTMDRMLHLLQRSLYILAQLL